MFCSTQQATVLSMKEEKIMHILKFHLTARKLQLVQISCGFSGELYMTFLALCLAISNYICMLINLVKLNVMRKVKIFTWIQWHNDLV